MRTDYSYSPGFNASPKQVFEYDLDLWTATQILKEHGAAQQALKVAVAEAVSRCVSVGLIEGSESGALASVTEAVLEALDERCNLSLLEEAGAM